MLNFIIWDVAPQIFTIPEFSLFGKTFGPLGPVWYGLLFATGFLVGQQIIIKIYKLEGKSEKLVETLTLYMIVATVVGARLGHCFFYEPADFLANPISILFIWEGGLASHGAGIAIIFAMWRYCKKYPSEKYLYILDRMAIIVALAACFIRFGNLMNSEIVGTPTNGPQAIVFVNPTTSYLKELDRYDSSFVGKISNVKIKETGKDTFLFGKDLIGIELSMKVKSFRDENMMELAKTTIKSAIIRTNVDRETGEYYSERTNIILDGAPGTYLIGKEDRKGTEVTIKAWGVPRHPAQLYESITSLLLFILLLYIYSRKKADTPQGLLFGIFMVWIFTLRFCYEFIKENQVGFESNMPLNMGQLLSIPMIVIGIVVLTKSLKKKQA